MTYAETIQYLFDRLPVFQHIGSAAYKPGLENTIRLMDKLNNPQKSFRSIHVAGTNGKGSVSHFLAAILQEAGYKVGLYTSPHLVDFGERIKINGEMINQPYVVDFVEKHMELFDEIEPSFFEATMSMAFNYFADCKVDVAVIEVGLGGRLDSTNIIQPELSVITNISFDHMGFLGETLEKIAYEKAGIIKSCTPVIIGESLPETRTVFEAKAKLENATIYYAEKYLKIKFKEYSEGKMIVETSDNKLVKVGLNGIYQLKNVATTLTAVKQLQTLNFNISEENLSNGIENVVEITGLQGRWQELKKQPLIIADTGHNVAGIKYVVEQLKTQKFSRLRIIFGMVNDKDVSTILTLLPIEADYYFTQANIIRALPAEELMGKAKLYNLVGNAFLSVEKAIESALFDSSIDDLIFIGGSNFVVGEALEFFRNNNK